MAIGVSSITKSLEWFTRSCPMRLAAGSRSQAVRRGVVLCLLVIATGLLTSCSSKPEVPLVLTEQGLGPVNATTSLRISELRQLFPRFRVISAESNTGDVEVPTIQVWEERELLFDLRPDVNNSGGLARIAVKSSKIGFEGKGRLGASYSELYGAPASELCVPGPADLPGSVICKTASSSHISLVFGGDVHALSDGSSLADFFQSLRVSQIWWQP